MLGRLVRWALGAAVPSARALPGGAPWLADRRAAGKPPAPGPERAPEAGRDDTAVLMAELQVLELRVASLRSARDTAYRFAETGAGMGFDYWRARNRTAQAIDKELQEGLQRALWLRAKLGLGAGTDDPEAAARRMRADNELELSDALKQLNASDRHLALRRAYGRSELRKLRLSRAIPKNNTQAKK